MSEELFDLEIKKSFEEEFDAQDIFVSEDLIAKTMAAIKSIDKDTTENDNTPASTEAADKIVNIGSTDQILCFFGKTSDHLSFPLTGKTSAASELCKGESIFSTLKVFDFLIQPLFRRSKQHIIIIFQPEIYFVDDLQQIDFKLHG